MDGTFSLSSLSPAAAETMAQSARADARMTAVEAMAGGGELDTERAQRVARDFEAIFLRQLIRTMRTTSFDGPLGNDPSTRMYKSMFDDALADKLADAGGLGIGDMVVESIQQQAMLQSEPRVDEAPRALPLTADPRPLVSTPDGQPIRVRTLQESEARAPIAIEPPGNRPLPLGNRDATFVPFAGYDKQAVQPRDDAADTSQVETHAPMAAKRRETVRP